MGGIPKPDPCYLDELRKAYVDGGRQVYKNERGNRFYTWDSMHGEIEVFDKRGVHLGVLDAQGNTIGDAVPNRRISKPN